MVDYPKILKGPDADAAPLLHPATKVLEGPAVLKLNDAMAALEAAHKEATDIIVRAKQEAEATLQEALEQGRTQGYAEVVGELAKVREERRNLQDAAQGDLLALAFKVAEQVISREVERDPMIVKEVVQSALEHARGRRHIVVKVHPDDMHIVEFSRAELELCVDGTSIHFEADASVTKGGAIIDTEGGQIQADLGLQLEALRKNLESS